MHKDLKKHLGLILCISSLVLFCLAKLPFNLSVSGVGENEGFSFVYGQGFLLRHEFAPGRGPLFILVYALILKLFGFNTWSIIAAHYVQTVVVLLISATLYLIVKEVLQSNFYAGLSVLFYILLIITPVGKAGSFEIIAHYSLEAEYFCVLFSLLSILFLLLSNFFKDNGSSFGFREKVFSFLSGLCAISSMLFKTNGAVLLIALFFLFGLLFVLARKDFNFKRNNIFYCFLGIIFSLVFCNVVLCIMKNDLFVFWRDYILIGSYNCDYLTSAKSLILSIFNFMTRYTTSINNFILFFIVFLLYIWGILRTFIIKDNLSGFLLLISIWGIGNVCAIISPGMYQPYYYDLIWPSIAMVLVTGLFDLFSYLKRSNIKTLSLLFIVIFFVHRLILMLPFHIDLAEVSSVQSVFNQPQSFQDPVEPYDIAAKTRPSILRVGDLVNVLLPDKKSTVYVFSFDERVYIYFTSFIYMYAKRYPPTSISSGLLSYDCILDRKLEILKRDLLTMPPKLLIVSREMNILPLNDKRIRSFLEWFKLFIVQNYKFERNVEYKAENESDVAIVDFYKRVK